jgi:hypothetical protein
MPAAADDWRRTSLGLPIGTRLRWRDYVAPKPGWDHDHCVFCWAKFVPRAKDGNNRLERDDHTIYFEGYATVESSGSGFEWACRPCFDDFATEFALAVVGDAPPDAR